MCMGCCFGSCCNNQISVLSSSSGDVYQCEVLSKIDVRELATFGHRECVENASPT